MRRRRGAETQEGQERLLAYWEPPEGAGSPVGCVATTYTFDAAFFEEECLARFAGIEGDPREDARSYLVEREERLAELFACVLVDATQVAPARSLRWHLLPVRLAGRGILHAKVSLLVWEHAVRVLVGSANLTEPAYRRNYEVAGALDFSADSDLPGSLLAEVVDFLESLRALAPGGAAGSGPGAIGPHRQLAQLLQQTRRRAGDWVGRGFRGPEPRVHFVPVGPGRSQLFEQVGTLFPTRSGPLYARVVSPFYDDGEGARRTVAALVGAMGVHGDRHIEFHAPGRQLPPPERKLELDLPACLEKPWLRRVEHSFAWISECAAADGDGDPRRLHAKSLWLEREDSALYVLGSSNFTAAGTGVAGPHANVEANLAYVLPDANDRFARICWEKTTPDAVAVDFDAQEVLFQQPDSRTAEGAAQLPLPSGFGQALFEPTGEGRLLLELGPEVPPGFRVACESSKAGEPGETLFTESDWRAASEPARYECRWKETRPPSHLVVTWKDDGGAEHAAIWVVNVTDASRLPPPEELRDLELEELLEVLTSVRPLHEAVAAILRRRETLKNARGLTLEEILNPHKRVDTRNFLIRRMRRVAAALEGLRERLGRPALSLDGLRWRLHGPVGPVRLAERLAGEEPDAAAFFVAEVLLTLRQLDVSRMGQHLGRAAVEAELAEVYRKLDAQVAGLPAPANLKAYVDEAFAGVRP